MFKRIMLTVILVVLAMVSVFSAGAAWMLRSHGVEERLEDIKEDAREVAWLAARSGGSTASLWTGTNTATTQYLARKSDAIYQKYGAYIVVVDRRGRVMDNLYQAQTADPEFIESLNGRELSDALVKVLGGEEVAVRVMLGGKAVFTVGVPYVRSGRVLGAVLIRTPAQSVESGVGRFVWLLLGGGALAALVCALLLFFYLRRVMRPLKAMTRAARAVSENDFSVRAEVDDAAPEVAELARAFNTMEDRINATEQSRREFVANVSHELRSPVTSISGFVQGMEDGTIPPEEHGRYLTLVGDETRRLNKLITDLLALSRLERDDARLSLSVFDICEMLRRAVIRRMDDLEKGGIEPVMDLTADPCPVRADPDRIEQVVVNLVDNAIKFTPEGGHLTLRTEVSKGVATVTVADDGIGITPGDRPRVFERFFTADRAHTAGKGTGLGLSICQRILEMHGQSIRLMDTERGTAFAFTLEAARAEEPARADPPDVAAP